ncbi:hypothetical protein J1N35_037935 [Gossypium stocksii]|uniref:Ribulose bisphosphate carboxylase large chain n=1 Tax=Gossypium stocksii TaxID=47602 RepID=A0A9D3UKX9_9ROSI|nr:hypothetical protein J1N35_037935 [Gossypium stocksii]
MSCREGLMSPQTETKAFVGFKAGVKEYKLTYYTPQYEVKDTDILAAFRVTPQPGVPPEEAGAAVAAESSTGTWTTVWTDGLTSLDRYKGRCYDIEPVPGEEDQYICYVAYPLDLFEEVGEQVDDVDGRLEASTVDESNVHDYDTIQEPYVGMIFESEGAAKTFYDDYARQVGFLPRVLSSHKSECDGLLFSRGLGCKGYHDGQTKVELQKQDKQESCSAMIHLRRDKNGRWVIKKFARDHNHPLVIQLGESRRTLDEEKNKKIQELTAELRVKKRLSASYREQLLAVVKEVENHNYNLSMKVQRTLDNLKKLDAEAKELLSGR